MGFYNQTQIGYYFQPFSKNQKLQLETETFIIQSSMCFYIMFYKGFMASAKYSLIEYQNQTGKVNSEDFQSAFSKNYFLVTLNPPYNLNAIQFGTPHYFNTLKP